MNSKQLINKALDVRYNKELMNGYILPKGFYKMIAKEAGVSYASLLSWKNGGSEPRYSHLLAVLNTCGLDLTLSYPDAKTR